jgi:tripeptidyl-peptidase-1
MLPIRIGLSQQNLHRGHDLLMSISDPSSPNYGQHLTANEVSDLFVPAKENVNTVKEWLAESGIARNKIEKTTDGSWIKFKASVAEAEELFKAEFWAWEFIERPGVGTVACDE